MQTFFKPNSQLIDLIRENADFITYKKGQYIYCEESTPLGVYFIQSGSVKLTKLGSEGREVIIDINAGNEMLGYIDLLSHTRYTTSAIALESCDVLFLSKASFWNIIREDHHFFEDFLTMVASDVLGYYDKITELAYIPVRGRVADTLLFMIPKYNQPKVDHPVVPVSRADLAAMVGTAKETVNRVLSEFRQDELIMTEGKSIIILNLRGLKQVVSMYN